jgi:hypothetical protein
VKASPVQLQSLPQPGTASDFSRYWREQLLPLVGGTILQAGTHRSEIGEEVPILRIKAASGQLATVEIWRDDEGNGPGALAITHATPPPARRRKT